MKDKVLIFDFDGTIADTFDHTLVITNRLSSEYGFKKIEPHEVGLLKDMPVWKIISYLRIPMIKVPFIAARVRQELSKEISLIKPAAGLKEVLLKLKESDYRIGILTLNSRKNVEKFLEVNGLGFNFILISSKIMGKMRKLKALMVKQALHPSNVLYVGDEVRDIEAAKKAGIRIAAVTWGYNSKKALEAYKPDYLVTKPEELLQICAVL